MSQQTLTWLDGTRILALPLPDRATDFGDGVFETLLLLRRKPLLLELHLERLQQGLLVLSLPDCLAQVRQQIAWVASQLDEEWVWTAIRVSVIRSPGPRGYAPVNSPYARILISASLINRDCATLSAAATMSIANIRLATQPALAGIKHLNRLEQVLAAAQAQSEHMDECVVLDQAGDPVSVIAGNLFLVRRGEILTPTLVDCGIAGTRRTQIMKCWGPAIGFAVRETKLTLADLMDAEEVFYSNSLQAVRPVQRINDRTWDTHTVCEALFRQFLDDIE